MAINVSNTLTSGSTSPTAQSGGGFTGLLNNLGMGRTSALGGAPLFGGAGAPTAAPQQNLAATFNNPVQPLFSPAPTLGSLNKAPVATHTITTNPDGTTTQKVTHVTDASGSGSGSTTTTTGTNPTPATTPTQSNTASFPGLVSSLASNSLLGSPVAGKAAQGLLGAASNNPLTSGGAYDTYSAAVKNLQDLKAKIAAQYGGIEGEAIPLGFQQGREQALSRQYASQLDAAQQAVNQAQAALGYGIQEQGQQISGLNSAGNLGIQGQGQLQSGLTSAAGLAAPALGSIGQNQYYNPLTGEGQNPGNSASPFSGGVAQGQAAAGAQFVQLSSANTAAKGIQNTITNFLQQNPDINPGNLAASNAIQQWIQGKQLSDPRYQSLFNYLSEYANTLAPILGVGGDPTNMKTQIAQAFVNAQASGQSIQQVLTNMSQLADDKLQNIKSGATGGGVIAGGSSPGTPGSASLYDF